ncbi:hypothetical protein CDAR_267681 [Caerostris darwini]|uniref:Uncharacterized protein n=1 Tax=Caerostris darwini TaxID=1538125 RepID=A0AAV4U457_9ARAC|nr:hypothetical protein CDAR_267681 [Caerostris darwini]
MNKGGWGCNRRRKKCAEVSCHRHRSKERPPLHRDRLSRANIIPRAMCRNSHANLLLGIQSKKHLSLAAADKSVPSENESGRTECEGVEGVIIWETTAVGSDTRRELFLEFNTQTQKRISLK